MTPHVPAIASITIVLKRMERDPVCPTGMVRDKDTITVTHEAIVWPGKPEQSIHAFAEAIEKKIYNLLREDE